MSDKTLVEVQERTLVWDLSEGRPLMWIQGWRPLPHGATIQLPSSADSPTHDVAVVGVSLVEEDGLPGWVVEPKTGKMILRLDVRAPHDWLPAVEALREG